MLSLQQNQRTRGQNRFCLEVGWVEGRGEVVLTMYTHVSKCKNDNIKVREKKWGKDPSRNFSKEDIQRANRSEKHALYHQSIAKCKSKPPCVLRICEDSYYQKVNQMLAKKCREKRKLAHDFWEYKLV
jgi:hypothetical protein